MSTPHEFHYRIPRRLAAWRPGSHPATSLGAGQEFVSHMSLYDRPDPRRLDLRASLRDIRGDWLIRVSRQRAAVAVQVIVDVSASMAFGSRAPKLHVVADFVEALGQSAFRVGDALGMAAFDDVERMDLFVPAMMSRGSGSLMGALLRTRAPAAMGAIRHQAAARGAAGLQANERGGAGPEAVTREAAGLEAAARGAAAAPGARGLETAALRFAGRAGLVFLVSDFHWPLDRLERALDLLSRAYVVPMVVWDVAEVEPPGHTGLIALRDVESGSQRTLWMRPKLRERWSQGVEQRRAELHAVFARHGIRPFFMTGGFDGEALSRYFFEVAA